MKEREISNELPPSKFVVYYDERYPTSWININNSKEIANFLSRKGFYIVNADKLKMWMDNLVTKENAEGCVVVFSQDVVPDTVFYDKTDALIKKYLVSGGRIVWIGDIPFYYRGYKDYEVEAIAIQLPDGKKEYRVNIVRNKLQQLGINDSLEILGLVSAFGFSQNKIKITETGRKWQMSNNHYGMRPVHLKFVTKLSNRIINFFKFGNKCEKWNFKNVLAVSKLEPPINIVQILPHRIREKVETEFTRFAHFGEVLKNILSLISILFGVGAIGITYRLAQLFGASNRDAMFLSLLVTEIIFLVLAPLYLLYRHDFHLYYANAWIKEFSENGGKFIRLWDYRPEEITDDMKEEIYNVAKYNLES